METEVISKCASWVVKVQQCLTHAIELLIQSYYNIVKRTMIDMVPKAIMLNLVNHSKEELQRELLTELYKHDVLDDLLQESDFTRQRRKECKKMIEVIWHGISEHGASLLTSSVTRHYKKQMRLLDPFRAIKSFLILTFESFPHYKWWLAFWAEPMERCTVKFFLRL